MSATTYDMSGLSREVERLQGFTKKTGPKIVDHRLANVSVRASNNTKRASKLGIRTELGIIAVGLRTTKKGKLTRGKNIYATGKKGAPLAALIVNARRGRAGKKGLHGKEMTGAVTRLVGGRSRSTGFNASGYFPGIKTLGSAQIKLNSQGISVKGQPKGRATRAQSNSLNPQAFLENSVKGITEVGGSALQDAIHDEAREIARHIAGAMKPGFDQFNK